MIKKRYKKQIKRKFKLNRWDCAFIHIFSSMNNTIITVSNKKGKTIFWTTSSSIGFKGNKKISTSAAQLACEVTGRKILSMGIREANIYVKGPGLGRDFAIRGLFNSGIMIKSISDVTPIPHNGCRPRKMRRR